MGAPRTSSYGSKGSSTPTRREEPYPISERHVAFSKKPSTSRGAEMQEILDLFKDYEDAKLELSEAWKEYNDAQKNVDLTKKRLYDKLDSLTPEQKRSFEKLLDIPAKEADDRDET